MPPRKLTTPFKAPRQATKKATTSPGEGRSKDNAECTIGSSSLSLDNKSCDDDDEPIVHQIPTYLKMLSEREADEMAKFGEVQRFSSDSEGDEVPIFQTLARALKEPSEQESVKHKDVGMKIARDFGKKGFFGGQVVAVEYESEDVDKNEDIYVVEYTDGDREDMNKEELVYANDFYVQVSGLDDDTPEGSLHTESGEEESSRCW